MLGHPLEHLGRGEDEVVRVARSGTPRPRPRSAASRPSAAAAPAASTRRRSSCGASSGSSRRTPCRARAPSHLRHHELRVAALEQLRRALGERLVSLVGRRRVERHVDLHPLRARRLRERLHPEVLEDLAQLERHLGALDDRGRRARGRGRRRPPSGARSPRPCASEVCSSRSARLASQTSVGRSSARQKSILPPRARLLSTAAVRTQSGRCDGHCFS